MSPAGFAAVADVVAVPLDEVADVADVVAEADVDVASFCASLDPHPESTRPATATADRTGTA